MPEESPNTLTRQAAKMAANYQNLQPLFIAEHREKTQRDMAERNGHAPHLERQLADHRSEEHAGQ